MTEPPVSRTPARRGRSPILSADSSTASDRSPPDSPHAHPMPAPPSPYTLVMVSSSCVLVLLLLVFFGQFGLRTEAHLSPTSAAPEQQPPVVAATEQELDNSTHQQADVASNSGYSQPLSTIELSFTEGGRSFPPSQQPQDSSNSYSNNLIPAVNSRASGESLELLERRLDRLEFELRKWKHQQQLQRAMQPPTSATGGREPSSAENGSSSQLLVHQLEAKWTSLSERLELMEKFITATTQKLYETEQRVKQLEKCECRLGCKWSQPAAAAETSTRTGGTLDAEQLAAAANGSASQQVQVLSKWDGQVWESNCDVCSCHRGHVRCSHIACPEPQCPDPHHVAGKCCPVCYKACVYKGQTVRHGNKLVINSNQETCKECMCIDGRLKCQRVEVANQVHRSQAAQEDSARRQQRSAVELTSASGDYREDEWRPSDDDYASSEAEEESDSSDADSVELSGEEDYGPEGAESDTPPRDSRRRRRQSGSAAAGSRSPPLVCPQMNCKPEQQFRLQNDCCTYCRGFDFCAHQHLCHPSADCLNTGQQQPANGTASSEPLPVSAMFQCRCRPGFRGDGRQCADIDECARLDLNECDSATTSCVNLAGSYQCRCRRGFRPLPPEEPAPQEQQQPEGEQSVTSVLVRTGTPTSERSTTIGELQQQRQVVRKCTDIDECADGKLNRCHPQAKCINLNGSYRCACKRGYLGNGIECHKWVSSDPKVAAYLHRHSPAPSDRVPALSDNPRSGQLAKVQLPLGTLDDPEDDQVDDEQSTARGAPDEVADEQDVYAGDQLAGPEFGEDNYATRDEPHLAGLNWSGPQLSEARQEPLRRDSQQHVDANQLERATGSSSGAPQALRNASSKDNQQASAALDPYQAMSSLNTRTMFLQPPPARFWRKNVIATTTATTTSTTSATNRPFGAGTNQSEPTVLVAENRPNGGGNDTIGTNKSANYGRSDRNDPVYIQPSSETAVNQPDPRQTRPTNEDSISAGQLVADGGTSNGSQEQRFSSNGTGHKRGTIIASAKLVSSRGRSPSSHDSAHIRRPSHIAAHRSAPGQASGAIPLFTTSKSTTITSKIISLITNSTGQSFLIMPYLIFVSLYIYCIHLNHVVTFYFI